MTPEEALSSLIKAAGSQTALAEALEAEAGKQCTQSNVHNWLRREKQISRNYVIAAYKLFPSIASLHQLRPDLYPVDVATLAAQPNGGSVCSDN